MNGDQIADNETQVGAYAGHLYDITSLVQKRNAIVITTYPTDYDRDLAVGFIDWNPFPPDNGTGVWRNVTLRKTGPVLLGSLSVASRFVTDDLDVVNVTFQTRAQNLENRTVKVEASSTLANPDRTLAVRTLAMELPPYESRMLSITMENLTTLEVWWPKQWGHQPLFNAHLDVRVDGGAVSDIRTATIGIREVTAKLNEHQDIVFYVNKRPFQVRGAGYTSHMFQLWKNGDRFTTICRYLLDMGLNTIRLEGKLEHPELYDIADRLGAMVLPGWECCDKWEAWNVSRGDLRGITPDFHNHIVPWRPSDYAIANASMKHEAAMLQTHPSVLGFMIGSDRHPDDQATDIYVDALNDAGWRAPIISSASSRGFPERLGPSGMKMAGPYDWVPPSY